MYSLITSSHHCVWHAGHSPARSHGHRPVLLESFKKYSFGLNKHSLATRVEKMDAKLESNVEMERKSQQFRVAEPLIPLLGPE